MQRECVIPVPSEVIESNLITAQIDNLLLIKELPPQIQEQKTEISKQVVTLPTINNKDTRIALLVFFLTTLNFTIFPPSDSEEVFTC